MRISTTLAALAGVLALSAAAHACPSDDDAAATAAKATPLDAATAAQLALMREEEKMARDVYRANFDRYGLRIFDNISRSEQRHMEAVLRLLQARGLADPAAEQPVGRFRSKAIQTLFDGFNARGAASVEAALKVGAEIEEVDIRDLTTALEATEAEDLKTVYQHLLRASHNHLRAYVRQLDKRGVAYAPKHLPSATYAAILAAPGHGGGGGHGAGAGKGAGRGPGHAGKAGDGGGACGGGCGCDGH